jgi:hypothetical protein
VNYAVTTNAGKCQVPERRLLAGRKRRACSLLHTLVGIFFVWALSFGVAQADDVDLGTGATVAPSAQSRQQSPFQGAIASWISTTSINSLKESVAPEAQRQLLAIRSASESVQAAGADIYNWLAESRSAVRWVRETGYKAITDFNKLTPELPSISEWIHGSSLTQDVVVDIRDAVVNGWVLIPRDQQWWMEFALVTAGVGTVVGWAAFGCAVVATPAGPVLVGLASGACVAVASHGGPEFVKLGYQRLMGRSLDESAVKAGTIAGTVVGAYWGISGSHQFFNWLQFRHFKDYGGYAAVAKSITNKSLAPWKLQTRLLRSNSYDIDHIVPVKCGFMMRMAPEVIGSISNLHALPASINRSIGSKGC